MLTARFPLTGLYRVEVSGWDKNQAFFVEKSELEWSEESGKRVALSNAVADGAVIFLRLLQTHSADRSHPVPYEAEFVAVTPEGQRQFRLHPVSPRSVERGRLVNYFFRYEAMQSVPGTRPDRWRKDHGRGAGGRNGTLVRNGVRWRA
jgi:hypothetical protein